MTTNVERYAQIARVHGVGNKPPHGVLLRCPGCGFVWGKDPHEHRDAEWLRAQLSHRYHCYKSNCALSTQQGILSPEGEAICARYNIDWPSLQDTPMTNAEQYKKARVEHPNVSARSDDQTLLACACGRTWAYDGSSDIGWLKTRLKSTPDDSLSTCRCGKPILSAFLSPKGEDLCRDHSIDWPSLRTPPKSNAERYQAFVTKSPATNREKTLLLCECGHGWIYDDNRAYDATWLSSNKTTHCPVCSRLLKDGALSPRGEEVARRYSVPWIGVELAAPVASLTERIKTAVAEIKALPAPPPEAPTNPVVPKENEAPMANPTNSTTLTTDALLAQSPTALQQVGATMKADFDEAKWRIGAHQLTDLAKVPIMAAIEKSLGPDDALRARLLAFFNTDLGEALVQGLLGLGLTSLPLDHPAIVRLAKELRIESMATAGDVVVTAVSGPVLTALGSLAQKNPAMARELAGLPLPQTQPMVVVADDKAKVPA